DDRRHRHRNLFERLHRRRDRGDLAELGQEARQTGQLGAHGDGVRDTENPQARSTSSVVNAAPFVILLVAALLGVIQGLTEFLPVSSTAHLLIGARLLGFDDPGGVFTVMIQLGSILAVMWLYRTKIIHIVTRLGSDADARHFALMIFIAFLPAVITGALLADYITTVLYESPKVFATTFILG